MHVYVSGFQWDRDTPPPGPVAYNGFSLVSITARVVCKVHLIQSSHMLWTTILTGLLVPRNHYKTCVLLTLVFTGIHCVRHTPPYAPYCTVCPHPRGRVRQPRATQVRKPSGGWRLSISNNSFSETLRHEVLRAQHEHMRSQRRCDQAATTRDTFSAGRHFTRYPLPQTTAW